MINKEDIKSEVYFYWFVDYFGYGWDYDIFYIKICNIIKSSDECFDGRCHIDDFMYKEDTFSFKELFYSLEEAEVYKNKIIKEKLIKEIIE